MYRCYMAEHIHEQAPIDRIAPHIRTVTRILRQVMGFTPNLDKPEVSSSVELTDVLVGGKLMDVIQTTAPRGSQSNDLEKIIVAAEAPLAVVSMEAHPAYHGRKVLYWVADRLGGGELRRAVMVRDSSARAGGGGGLPRLVTIEEDHVPLAALFDSRDDSMATPGAFTCDAVVRIARPSSPNDQLDIVDQLLDPRLRGLHADAGIELSAVMRKLSESKRR